MPQLDERLFLQSFTRLLSELLEGPAPDAAFMLNRGDRGLFASMTSVVLVESHSRRSLLAERQASAAKD
jgi:hypothetical protein